MRSESRFLIRRGNLWTYRRDVPTRHQKTIGVKVWKFATGEGSLAKAEVQARVWAAMHDEMISDLDEQGARAARALAFQRDEAVRRATKEANSTARKLLKVRAIRSDDDRAEVDAAREAASQPEIERARWLDERANAQARQAVATEANPSVRREIAALGGIDAAINALRGHDEAIAFLQAARDMLGTSPAEHVDPISFEDKTAGIERRLAGC